MYLDSCITERIISYFNDRSIPILSIHDSYVVPFGYDNVLMKEMKAAFFELTEIKEVKLTHTTINSNDYWWPEKCAAGATMPTGIRDALKGKGIRPSIPGQKSRGKPIKHDKRGYKRRNGIEIMSSRLKDWRRVATRYDRCPKVFPSAIARAANVMFWLLNKNESRP